jgi:hypothetical protein
VTVNSKEESDYSSPNFIFETIWKLTNCIESLQKLIHAVTSPKLLENWPATIHRFSENWSVFSEAYQHVFPNNPGKRTIFQVIMSCSQVIGSVESVEPEYHFHTTHMLSTQVQMTRTDMIDRRTIAMSQTHHHHTRAHTHNLRVMVCWWQ